MIFLSGCAGRLIPNLTHEQMYEDYDHMVDVLTDMMPHAAVIREAYGIDVWQKLAGYRKKIPTIKDTRNFAVLVDCALRACKGHHLNVDSVSPTADSKWLNKIYGEENAVKSATINKKLKEYCLMTQRKSRYPQKIYLTYYDGEYYVPTEFTVNENTYPALMKLLTVDGRTPVELEHKFIDKLNYFDSKHRRFYGSDFYCYQKPKTPGERTFTFLSSESKEITLTVKDTDKVEMQWHQKSFFRLPKRVLYLPEHDTVYIRVPAMNHSDVDFYLAELTPIMHEHKPRFAVIDIRNNPGGSDLVPITLVKTLLPTPKFITKFAYLASARQKEELKFRGHDTEKYQEKAIDFLDGQKFLIVENQFISAPEDTVSPKVQHLYILADNVYSAAGTLVMIGKDNDDITSIGFNNPLMLGRGVNPYVFALPWSKLAIRVEPALDINHCQTAADCLHTNIDVELNLSVKEFFDYHLTPVEENNVAEFLKKQDPFMRKAFELMPQ